MNDNEGTESPPNVWKQSFQVLVTVPEDNTGSPVSVFQSTDAQLNQSHKVLREQVWDVSATSRAVMIRAGGEIGFLEYCKDIAAYARGHESRFLNLHPVPKEGTGQASPRESRVCFSECFLLPNTPQN